MEEFFIDGRIPYLLKIKSVLYFLAWILPFSVFFFPGEFREFAEIGWTVLIGVLSIRPLAGIFPDFKVLRTLVILRREFGVFSGMMILAHFAGYLMVNSVSLRDIFVRNIYR